MGSRLAALIVSVLLVSTTLTTQQRAAVAAAGESAKVQTRDGVELSLTYYPSLASRDPQLGKQVTPVILLHDEKDTQGMFSSLIDRLQQVGQDRTKPSFSVVTVDLRGHGASTRQTAPNGQTRQLDAAKLSREDILAMSLDLEAVRGFLVGKNDAGELNLNKLCLVGVGLGATVAANWAAKDWLAPPLLVGKQGQDVKALVLISPQWKYRGIMLQQAFRVTPLKQGAAWLIVYGEQASNQAADAKRIVRQLERFHPEPQSPQAPPRSLDELPIKSGLEGSGLLSQEGQTIEDKIVDFLTTQVGSQDLPWSKRRNRLE
jgi:pimeloyl-ACP methyl ester carboxylesterase